MNRKNFLVVWVRLDSQGYIIPGTLQTRPRSAGKPADGRWVQWSPYNECCNGGPCIITFSNTSADTDITSIESSGISWSGTIANGEQRSFVIPNCYNMEFTTTLSAPGAEIDITATTTYGDGVIEATPDNIASGASPVTTVITTTATPGSEYLVVIENA